VFRQLVDAQGRDLNALAFGCGGGGDSEYVANEHALAGGQPPVGAVTVIMSPRWMKFFIGQTPFVA
jgi:hypothetical protein